MIPCYPGLTALGYRISPLWGCQATASPDTRRRVCICRTLPYDGTRNQVSGKRHENRRMNFTAIVFLWMATVGQAGGQAGPGIEQQLLGEKREALVQDALRLGDPVRG